MYASSSDDASVLLSSTLTPDKGLHTTSTTRLALRGSGSRSRARTCTLHLYFSLPTQLFADPYELAHLRASYAFERFGGVGNLEAPVFAPGAGGPSGLMLDLGVVPEDVDVHVHDDEDEGIIIEVDVPLHARYGVPKTGGDLMDEVVLPPPEAFWACPATDNGEAKRTEVPDALRKVVELAPALIDIGEGERRTLVSIPRAASVRAQTLRVPVGDAGDVAVVEACTVVVILLAFVYLLRTLARASGRGRSAPVRLSATKKDN